MVAVSAVGPAGSPSAGVHGTTSPLSWTHILGASDTAILVGVTNANSNTNNVTSVTIGASNIQVPFVGISANPSGVFTAWYGLVGPPTGSQTVKVNFSGTPSDMLAGSISFTQAGGFGQVFTANSGASNTASQTVSVPVTTPGGVVVETCAFGGTGWSAFTTTGSGGTIQLSDPVSSTFAGDMQAIGTYASTGAAMTVGLSAGAGGADFWSLAAVEVLPPVHAPRQSPVPPGRNSPMAFRFIPRTSHPPSGPYEFGSSTGTGATAVTQPTGAGDGLIAIFAGTTASNITGVTDTKGNTWSRLHQYNLGTFDIEVWATFSGIALTTSDTITPAFSSWTSPRQIYLGYPGITAEDAGAYVVTNATSTAPSSGASGALAAANELVLGIICDGNGGGAVTWDAGWNPVDSVHTGSTEWLNVAWRVPADTSPVTASGTIASVGWTALVVAFGFGSPSTPVTLADAAAGISEDGALVVAADVPLAEAAAAVEALAASVTEAGSDAAGAVEGLAVTVSVPLADVAAGTDTETEITSFQANLADVAAAADAAAITVAVPLAEAGAAADARTSNAAVPLAEAGAAADSLALSAAVPLADAGAAADAITGAATLSLTDAGAATEFAVSGVPVGLADAAGAADAPAIAAAIPLTDAGGAADSITLAVTVILADKGAATELAVSGVPISFTDAAGSVDALTAAVTAGLADAAGAAEALGIAATAAPADVAAAVEAISVAITSATAQGDVAAARDAISISVSVPLSESAGAADQLRASAAVGLSDAAGAVEAIVVVTGIHPTGTVTWAVRPEAPRWRSEPAEPRWEARPGEARWNADPELARWSTRPDTARWRNDGGV
jgi:hypothetical protein